MIGLIDATDGGDPLSAKGNLWGDAIGDSFGAGSLDLADGGSGIGLGNIGTLGHGRVGGAHLRPETVTVTGRLSRDEIQRIVRRHFSRFRFCYERELVKDPTLAGTIATRFVIDAKGDVTSSASDPSKTTITDANMIACVSIGFSNISFPQPDGGGTVVVVYPLTFAPEK
ncbi:MAG TPA: AgmX/PglI C-terminal domain-containing protein [Polyangiaceae bacterium]|jgi:hypothetical protein